MCLSEKITFFLPHLMRIFLARSRVVGFQILTKGNYMWYFLYNETDINLTKFAEFL